MNVVPEFSNICTIATALVVCTSQGCTIQSNIKPACCPVSSTSKSSSNAFQFMCLLHLCGHDGAAQELCTREACKAIKACKHMYLKANPLFRHRVGSLHPSNMLMCKSMQAHVPHAICCCCHRARTLHPGSTQSRHSVRPQGPEALHRPPASARHSRRITPLSAEAPAQQLVKTHFAMTQQVRLVKPAGTTA